MSISEATRSLVVDRSAPGVFTTSGSAPCPLAVRREAEVLTSMRHPRVPAVIDVTMTASCAPDGRCRTV
jgi:hypothetical protein